MDQVLKIADGADQFAQTTVALYQDNTAAASSATKPRIISGTTSSRTAPGK